MEKTSSMMVKNRTNCKNHDYFWSRCPKHMKEFAFNIKSISKNPMYGIYIAPVYDIKERNVNCEENKNIGDDS